MYTVYTNSKNNYLLHFHWIPRKTIEFNEVTAREQILEDEISPSLFWDVTRPTISEEWRAQLRATKVWKLAHTELISKVPESIRLHHQGWNEVTCPPAVASLTNIYAMLPTPDYVDEILKMHINCTDFWLRLHCPQSSWQLQIIKR